MHAFKVGDFIRYIAQNKNDYCDGEILRIIEINNSFAFFEEYEKGYHINLLEPWAPHNGEWCWFWDDCTPHRPTCRQFGYIDVDNYGSNAVYCDSEQNPYTNCEPFLNSLPLHLQ